MHTYAYMHHNRTRLRNYRVAASRVWVLQKKLPYNQNQLSINEETKRWFRFSWSKDWSETIENIVTPDLFRHLHHFWAFQKIDCYCCRNTRCIKNSQSNLITFCNFLNLNKTKWSSTRFKEKVLITFSVHTYVLCHKRHPRFFKRTILYCDVFRFTIIIDIFWTVLSVFKLFDYLGFKV